MSMNDQELDRRLSALPISADVDADIWEKIERRIEHRHARPSFNLKWAGGIAAAVAAVAIFTVIDQDSTNFTELYRAQTIQAEVQAMNATTLLPQLAAQINWSDDMRTAWNEYQTAIDELEAALELNPGYQVLIETLAATRLRQSDLLNRAQSIGIINVNLDQTQNISEGATSYEI